MTSDADEPLSLPSAFHPVRQFRLASVYLAPGLGGAGDRGVVGGEVRARARDSVASLESLGRGGLDKMGIPLSGAEWHRGCGR
jgi:hypothetical protein